MGFVPFVNHQSFRSSPEIRAQPASEPIGSHECVVAVRQVVVQGGKAALLALHLHARQAAVSRSRIAGRSPVVRSAVHRETGRQRSIGANDQRILPRAAVPLLQFAAHERLHFLQPANGVHHLIAGTVLVDEPIDGLVDDRASPPA